MAPLSPRVAFVRTAFAPPRDSAALAAAVDQVLGLGLGSGVGVGVGVGVRIGVGVGVGVGVRG